MTTLAGLTLVLALGTAACGPANRSAPGSATETTVEGAVAPPTSASATTSSVAPEPSDGPATGDTADPTVTLAPKQLRLSTVEIASVEFPTAIAARAGDSAMYVASQAGKVHSVREGATPKAVLDISADVRSGGEQGLIGLTFSPDGKTGFVDYTRSDGSIQVESMPVLADGTFDATARRVILNIPHPGEQNHNGGNLVFGPDGMLYIGVGDGGGSGDPERHGQDLRTLLGKILRIDPLAPGEEAYQVPDDNPFVSQKGARGEIWSYGLRNPWRFSFDHLTGDLWIGDVGQNEIEEVDLVRAGDGAGRGANFGWSAYEGSKRFNKDQAATDRVKPLYEYRHRKQSSSITGGFVYRGHAFPAAYGAYLFADEVRGQVWGLRVSSKGKAVVAEIGSVETLSSFGEDNNGELYALSYGPGKVYRLAFTTPDGN